MPQVVFFRTSKLRFPNVAAGLRVVRMFLLVGPWLVPPVFGPNPAFATLLIAWGALGLTALVSVQPLPTSRFDQDIAAAWLLAALVSSVFAACQYFGVEQAFGGVISSANPGEVFANLRQRNQFATLANIGLAVTLLWPVTGAKKSPAVRRVAALMAVLFALVNAASASRTGLVQLLLLFAMVTIWQSKREGVSGNPPAGFVVGAYFVAALVLMLLAEHQHAGGGILSRTQEVAPGCSSRLVLWSNVVHLIAQKPLAGWGWGELDFAHFATLYPGERFCEILDNAHNLPLHLAVELGVPVALLVCSVIVMWVVRNAPWRETNSKRQMAWGVLAMIALHSMLEYPLWYGPFQMAVVLCLALLWCTPSSLDGEPVELAMRPRPGNWVVIFGVVCIAICAGVAWDYWRVSQLYMPVSERAVAYRENALENVKGTWFFRDLAQFAELTTTPLTADNAAHLNVLAKRMLHFSPEPRVIEVVIESAVMLGQDAEALYYLQRFKAAFPQAHAEWAAHSAAYKTP